MRNAIMPKTKCWIGAGFVAGLLATAAGFAQQQPAGQERTVGRQETRPDAPPVRPYPKLHALCIGINDYAAPGIPDLSYAESDAREMAQVLKELYGFDSVRVLLGKDATRANVNAALAELFNPNKIGPEDGVVIYFSGHGQTLRQGNAEAGYLIPQDANIALKEINNPEPYRRETLRMDDLRTDADGIPARHVLFVVDACYSGFLASRSLAEAAPEIANALKYPARQVITAGTAGEEAVEHNAWGHGAFTYKLLEILRAEEKPLSASKLGVLLKERVPREVAAKFGSKRTLSPQAKYLSGEGDFIFARPGVKWETANAAPSPAPSPQPARPGGNGDNTLSVKPPSGSPVKPPQPPAAAVLVSSSFERDLEGWTAADNLGQAPSWSNGKAELHNPSTIEKRNARWVAPAKFLGNRAAAFGGRLRIVYETERFSEKTVGPQGCIAYLIGGGKQIVLPLQARRSGQATVLAPLDASGGWLLVDGKNIGGRAADEDIRQVLANLTELKIRADFTAASAKNTVRLDEVAIELPAAAPNANQAGGNSTSGDGVPPPKPRPSPQDRSEPPAPVSEDAVVSRFDVDDEGWRLEGGNFGGLTAPHHSESEKYVHADDALQAFWIAPAKFLGDHEALYGKALSFDAAWKASPSYGMKIILAGGGVTLYYLTYPPLPQGSSYWVELNEQQGWQNEKTNKRATAAEIRTALKTLSQIKLQAGHQSYCWIDNVVLGDAPTPRAGPVSSQFQEGNDGWRLAGGSFGLLTVPEHIPDQACLVVQDGHYAFWISPPKFRGDFSALLGKKLVLEDAWEDAGNYDGRRVILYGGGMRIYAQSRNPPNANGGGFSIGLTATASWYFENNTRVTEDQMKRVLSRLQRIEIKGGNRGKSQLKKVILGAD